MRKILTLSLLFFAAFTMVLLPQNLSKDRTQTPKSFDNPVAVYGPVLENPTGTLSESFEDPTFPPTGWMKYSPDGGTGWDRLTAGTTPIPGWTGGTVTVPPGGGSATAFCTWSTGGAASNDQWLVSSQVTGVASGDTLSFWVRKVFDYADNLDILISTTDNQMASFTTTVDNIVYSTTDTGWVYYSYNLTDFVNAGDDIYIAFREHVADNFNDGDAIFVDLVSVAGAGVNVIPISQAIEDLDNDFVPDHLGETVTIQGVVFSPNYQTTNNSFYISDGTAGTDIFMYSPPLYTWNMGDMLEITGVVSQYNGMTEIIPDDSTGWVFMSSGNPTPDPVVLTLGQYLANAEMYEGSLVGFVSLNKVGGNWPTAGSSANLQLSDGQDTITFRIDSDTDIDGQPEPTWPVDVIGIGSQYDSSTPPDGGYQIFPRFYATDFLPANTLPVELTSFSAKANINSVSLSWNTSTEVNNKGFEVQRNSGSGFATIGFIQGYGTSTQSHSYSFVDQNLSAGQYTYRLKQVDFNGTYSFSNEVSVELNPVTYSLAQNYPNPFNPTTMINFNLRVDSKVSLKVFNILGQQVAQLVNGSMVAGNHQINFNASNLNSGVYLYRLEATGIDGSSFSAVKKMMLTK